jgi:VanZ family protein
MTFAVIIYFSAQNGTASSAQSDAITTIFIEKPVVDNSSAPTTPSTETDDNKLTYHKLSKIVRKMIGHFGLFGFLGIFAFLTYKGFLKNKILKIILTILSGFLIAGLSEFIQLFVEGRYGCMQDVMIDYSGYLLGCLVVYLIVKLISIVQSKKEQQNAAA